MESLSFDSMVERYDETRGYDRDCFDAASAYLADRFYPQDFDAVLEPGIGNSRIAIPLVERGYQVTGVDISREMLALLKNRLIRSGRSVDVAFQEADTTRLPFSDAALDMALVVHLFYVVPERLRSGVGRMMADFFLQWLGDRGVADVLLNVVPDNPVSNQFWRSQGFEPCRVRMKREVRPTPS
jgi:SAM-dependent methyltransferase